MKEKMLSPGLEVGGGLVPDESEEPRRHDKLGWQTSLTKRSLSWVILFRQFFDLASGTYVRSTVGLILVIKSFNAFNFCYSIIGNYVRMLLWTRLVNCLCVNL